MGNYVSLHDGDENFVVAFEEAIGALNTNINRDKDSFTASALALEINQRIDSCLQALSINSQRLWFKLIDEFYVNFDEFEEAKFINMLQENEDVNYYLDMLETLRGDVVPYNEEDMNLCIEKLKQIGIDKDQKAIQQRIVSSVDVAEQSRLIDEKFRKKRTKESLKNRRK